MAKKELLTAVLLLAAITAAGDDPEKLKKVAGDAIESLQAQENNVETANQVINELQEANERQKRADKNYRPEVTAKGELYRVVHGFNDGTKVLTIDDIAKDLTLVKKLGDSDSTAVVKLPKATKE
jgi:2-phosphoglycerate kinase